MPGSQCIPLLKKQHDNTTKRKRPKRQILDKPRNLSKKRKRKSTVLLRLLRKIRFLHSHTYGHKNPYLLNLHKISTRHWQIAPIQTNPTTLYKRQRRILHRTPNISTHPRIANQRNARKPHTISSHIATPVITMTPPREDLLRPFIKLYLYPPWKKNAQTNNHTNRSRHLEHHY